MALNSDAAFELLCGYNVFEKEIEFYDQIRPKINAKLREFNKSDQLIAETYGVCKKNQAILFEDLTCRGLRCLSVYQGYDLHESKLVLRKIATFHAVNAILKTEEPNIFENFKYSECSSQLISHSDEIAYFPINHFLQVSSVPFIMDSMHFT